MSVPWSPRQVSALVAAMVLFVGAAFVHLGLRTRAAEERATLTTVSREAGAAVQTALAAECEIARGVARRMSQAASIGELERLAEEAAHARGRPAIALALRGALQLYGVTFSSADRQQLAVALRTANGPQEISIAGLYQTTEGPWFLLVRVPLVHQAPEVGRAGISSIAVAFPVERLLDKSGLARLPSRGFDYVLSGSTATGRLPSVVRSTAFALEEPAEQIVPVAGTQPWSLAVARRGGSHSWQPTAVSATLVAILAFGLALVARDLAGRPERLRAEQEKHIRRLRETERRLLDEMQQRSEVEHQFANAGFHDALTGLPNQRFFINSVTRALERLRHQVDAHVAVFAISFDRFKAVNETLGYRAGDEMLTLASQRIMAALGPSDPVLARISGDQFGLLIVGLPDTTAAEGLAQRLHDAVAKPFQIGRETVFTTASVGIAFRWTGLAHPDELLREADIALSRSASAGRARTVLFDQQAADDLSMRQQLETDLNHALEREEFLLYFQPIVELPTGRIAGMETLVRWHHPLQGVLPPAAFIGVAEKAGLIVPITRWVLREACRQARAWRDRLGTDRDFYLSVNLSVHDLGQSDLCDFVSSVVRQADLAPGTVRLEVTESVLIEDIRAANELVAGLRQLGVPLLLDDFGTGYSSLSYLTHFRVDYLKIDKSFVRNVAATTRSSALLRSIVHLASDLDITPIAEGIETLEDLERLLELGCRYGQGYYFSRPVPVEQAEALLVAGRVPVAEMPGPSQRMRRRSGGQAVA